MKTCSKCNRLQEALNFSKDSGQPDKLYRWCKQCVSTHRKEYQKENPERCRVLWRNSQLRRRYHVSPERFKELLEKQGNRCLVCAQIFTTTPHIDHDHKCCPGKFTCGKCVRGLLCTHCNVGLGHFMNSPENLRKAVEYLENYDNRGTKVRLVGAG